MAPKHRDVGRALSQSKENTRRSRTPLAQSDLVDERMRGIHGL